MSFHLKRARLKSTLKSYRDVGLSLKRQLSRKIIIDKETATAKIVCLLFTTSRIFMAACRNSSTRPRIARR